MKEETFVIAAGLSTMAIALVTALARIGMYCGIAYFSVQAVTWYLTCPCR